MTKTNAAGHSIDPKIAGALKYLASLNLPPLQEMTPDQAREGMRKLSVKEQSSELFSVTDQLIAGDGCDIPLRVYRPQADETLPVIVFYHGGGWVVCDLDTHDECCRRMARQAQCVVVSVDYRLAPEHPFPAGLEDAYTALQWVSEHAAELNVDTSRLAIGGDSAGANLAAAAALRARDEQGPAINFQLLIYPVTNVRDMDAGSYLEFSKGYRLEKKGMEWFREQYIGPNGDAGRSDVSPLLADELKGLPDTYVATAGFDVLRDEGEAYAKALAKDGVKVAYSCFGEQIHGFVGLADIISSSSRAYDQILESLAEGFA